MLKQATPSYLHPARLSRRPQSHPRGLTRKRRPLYSARFAAPGTDPVSEGPCGGTGRRARLKIEFRKECWFDSGQGHQSGVRPRPPTFIFLNSDGHTSQFRLRGRAITNPPLMRDKSVVRLSVTQSTKYSCSGSPDMFWNGSTAMEGLSGRARGLRSSRVDTSFSAEDSASPCVLTS